MTINSLICHNSTDRPENKSFSQTHQDNSSHQPWHREPDQKWTIIMLYPKSLCSKETTYTVDYALRRFRLWLRWLHFRIPPNGLSKVQPGKSLTKLSVCFLINIIIPKDGICFNVAELLGLSVWG